MATKLPEPDRKEVLDSQRARPFGEWVVFPVEEHGGVEALLPWLEKAYEYVQVTPPKGRRTSGRAE